MNPNDEEKWFEAERSLQHAYILMSQMKDYHGVIPNLDRRALAVAITHLETAQLWMAKAKKAA